MDSKTIVNVSKNKLNCSARSLREQVLLRNLIIQYHLKANNENDVFRNKRKSVSAAATTNGSSKKRRIETVRLS